MPIVVEGEFEVIETELPEAPDWLIEELPNPLDLEQDWLQ